ncbi:MAG: glycoside hydrolase family 9 protein [Defluviitaleaceae bacterium]|nr:glycoside hydrolase family 9 protein [Defluviitaleaceae bacterium]MCL2275364.1 glycoside hydrolase family 9 protein [Defluviitaleaceae bacterium]
MEYACWIRLNRAGYVPNRPKIAVVLADKDITGARWRVTNDENVVLEGTLRSGLAGDNIHVAQAFSYEIDFTSLTAAGTYTFELDGAQKQTTQICPAPYAVFARQALLHLRHMRSGCDTPMTKAGHLKDDAAIMHIPDGARENGAWKPCPTRRTLDMRGGFYDAGDYIKFTLTIASMTWHLLRAYEENAALFDSDLLDEAKYALDYLAKIHPDSETFVIQVGAGADHNEGWRLAADDRLDGKRPAFCALSRAHMGSASAALALGAVVFAKHDATASDLYAEKAVAIYKRARMDDTLPTAFERNETNDFYYDKTDTDNMALAAAELFRLTNDVSYLNDGEAYAPPPMGSVSWGVLNGNANFRLAQAGDKAATARFLEEATQYKWDNPWTLPGGKYGWGSLPVWMGIAINHELARRYFNVDTGGAVSVPLLGVLDYTFGRNNWGIGMVASDEMPHTIRNVYNAITNVLGKLSVGAMSEGPGNRKRHDMYTQYFRTPADNPFDRFNTNEMVFYDDSYDFMIAESTIWGQGNLILMLALA